MLFMACITDSSPPACPADVLLPLLMPSFFYILYVICSLSLYRDDRDLKNNHFNMIMQPAAQRNQCKESHVYMLAHSFTLHDFH
jgi:hypothetical protein